VPVYEPIQITPLGSEFFPILRLPQKSMTDDSNSTEESFPDEDDLDYYDDYSN
jgi:hypothetical protein